MENEQKRSRAAKRAIWFLLSAVLPTLGSGCLFQPREAQAPAGEEAGWVVPDEPSVVFVNMENGLESLKGTNYEKSIASQFVFVPLPSDADQLPGAFDGWNAQVEKEVTRRIIGDSQSIQVDFLGLTRINNDISFAQFQGSYELTLVSKAAQDTVVYKGKAQFELREGSRGWEMVRWEEIESVVGYPTWGYLRGSRRQL